MSLLRCEAVVEPRISSCCLAASKHTEHTKAWILCCHGHNRQSERPLNLSSASSLSFLLIAIRVNTLSDYSFRVFAYIGSDMH